ncbi:hypothetical protein D1007_13801 [Hordeum vulgare]|nr:hypothetical protein D1007_13801 [Hordeum vulgare]
MPGGLAIGLLGFLCFGSLESAVVAGRGTMYFFDGMVVVWWESGRTMVDLVLIGRMACCEDSSSSSVGGGRKVEDLMKEVALQEDVLYDVVFEESDAPVEEDICRMNLFRVHMDKSDLALDDGYSKPTSVEIYKFDISTKILDVPIAYNGKVKALASKLGEFVDSQSSSFDFEGNFCKVRVHLDVLNPLKKATSIIRGGVRIFFAVKYERLSDWCQVCGMMGHEFKEHGDGVHPPSALIFKNLRAPATTAWSTRHQNNNQRSGKQDISSRDDGDEARTDGDDQGKHELEDVEMDASEDNRKRASNHVVVSPEKFDTTRKELALVTKRGDYVPPSPLPKKLRTVQLGNSQRDKYPEEYCLGVWLSLRILDSW